MDTTLVMDRARQLFCDNHQLVDDRQVDHVIHDFISGFVLDTGQHQLDVN